MNRSYENEELLFEYAAGVLDDARRFMIDAHTRMSEQSRRSVALGEELGGYLLTKDCADAQMSPAARQNILDKIAQSEQNTAAFMEQKASHCTETIEILKSLGLHGKLLDEIEGSCRAACSSPKKSVVKNRVQFVKLDKGCNKSTIRLMRIAAGTEIPTHSHNGEEMTLILLGHMQDEYGDYYPGDLIVRHDGDVHTPRVLGDDDCVCLALTYSPLKMKCVFKRFFNIFYRF